MIFPILILILLAVLWPGIIKQLLTAAALLALVLFASLLDRPAHAAEPFPNWDVNQAALAQTLDMLKSADKGAHSEWSTDKDRREALALLDTDRDVLFKHWLNAEIKARNYLVAHWAGYTEYYQILCMQDAAKLARLQLTPGVPSYLSLLMCVPDGFPTANSIMIDTSDLPLAVSQ